jgi:hypothetical protein
MLATEVQENFYLNVTKLRAATVLPPGLRHAFGGFRGEWAAVPTLPADRPGVGGPWKTGTVRWEWASLRRLARARWALFVPGV